MKKIEKKKRKNIRVPPLGREKKWVITAIKKKGGYVKKPKLGALISYRKNRIREKEN